MMMKPRDIAAMVIAFVCIFRSMSSSEYTMSRTPRTDVDLLC